MGMTLTFASVSEDRPGPKLARLFAGCWPAYRKWWASEGVSARPTYMECRKAIRRHMPELAELYDEIVELVGGGDAEARFLSFYCPPKYLSGCSQAIWQGNEPLLVRNYDYDPRAFDATALRTAWLGRQVMGMSDGLLGILDGVNDAGLAVSLTFGGRRETGAGFGVPLILRYVLETCDTVEDACDVLARVPCHMSYNVTVLDAERRFATAFLAPDREAVITNTPVATNHQERVEWSSHARITATVERERFLLQRLTLHPETKTRFIQAFLKPPLYSMAFSRGFGTLYTAAYHPRSGRMRLFWPGSEREFRFNRFPEENLHVLVPETA
jgi:predicted choloylglycine hydrolase